jgi:NAD(P)-dependent dehydrogenase (short-subunit alcohol dehydrogenase family)
VSNSEAAERVVAAAAATGRVDILVNNAGLLRDRMLWKLEDADWDAVVGVSLGGTFRLTRACMPHFRRRQYGRVVNVTSYTGLHGNVGQSAYAAAKAGVIGFTKTAAKELAGFGVTVNAISPNAQTRMVESIPEDHRETPRKQIALGSFGELDSMLFDVAPDGSERLVTRGAYRLTDNQSGRVSFQLHGNGYAFAAGHTAKLVLLGSDVPYLRPSNNLGFVVNVSDLSVSLPTVGG